MGVGIAGLPGAVGGRWELLGLLELLGLPWGLLEAAGVCCWGLLVLLWGCRGLLGDSGVAGCHWMGRWELLGLMGAAGATLGCWELLGSAGDCWLCCGAAEGCRGLLGSSRSKCPPSRSKCPPSRSRGALVTLSFLRMYHGFGIRHAQSAPRHAQSVPRHALRGRFGRTWPRQQESLLRHRQKT